MSAELQNTIRHFTTPHLLEQLYRRRSEYNPEALELMKREVAFRGITEEEIAPYRMSEPDTPADNAAQEFRPLDHTFSQTDILLAHAVLRDAGIPFFVDGPGGSTIMPLQTEAARQFRVHVPTARFEQVRALLEEHFHGQEGHYRLKHTDTFDRLRAFRFTEVRMDEAQMEQEIATALTPEERAAIAGYGRRLLAEVDAVEAGGRILFYYDNIEELLARLGQAGNTLRLMDLATVLEVLQVYCDEEGFPAGLVQAAGALLEAFEA